MKNKFVCLMTSIAFVSTLPAVAANNISSVNFPPFPSFTITVYDQLNSSLSLSGSGKDMTDLPAQVNSGESVIGLALANSYSYVLGITDANHNYCYVNIGYFSNQFSVVEQSGLDCELSSHGDGLNRVGREINVKSVN